MIPIPIQSCSWVVSTVTLIDFNPVGADWNVKLRCHFLWHCCMPRYDKAIKTGGTARQIWYRDYPGSPKIARDHTPRLSHPNQLSESQIDKLMGLPYNWDQPAQIVMSLFLPVRRTTWIYTPSMHSPDCCWGSCSLGLSKSHDCDFVLSMHGSWWAICEVWSCSWQVSTVTWILLNGVWIHPNFGALLLLIVVNDERERREESYTTVAEVEGSKSVRERYIRVAAIDNVITEGPWNICVVNRYKSTPCITTTRNVQD
jgi:hypothetical protein